MTKPPITASSTIRINAPASEVWSVVADYSRDAEWRVGVVSMTSEPRGPVSVGTTTTEQFRMLGQRMTNLGLVDSVSPGEQFHWRTTKGADADGARIVTPITATSCSVELTIASRPSGFIETLLRPFIAGALQRAHDESVTRLKQLIEQPA